MIRRPIQRAVLSAAIAVLSAVTLSGTVAGATPGEGLAPLGSDFLWGVASAGFQNEGHAPDSNWSRYAAGGAVESYGDSVDFYHRYREDIALAKSLGVQVYRLSIEWARIQPQPGTWDNDALSFYDNVVAEIRAAGMRPMLTLDHWVYPGWEVDRGGWSAPQMLDDWLANARVVVDRYADDNPLWVTLNEPVFYPLQEMRASGLSPAAMPAMVDRLVAAHNTIYDYIHARRPDAMVTSNVAYFAGAEAPLDTVIEDRIGPKLDFIGIDYYYGATPATAGSIVSALQNEPWKSQITPEGIYYALRFYARKFPGRPLYIIENGMPTENANPRADGWTRAEVLRDTVYWLQRAKADGMNLIGYNYWSLTDNYEWGSYTPRFGLYTVDVKTDPTLTRRPTDAVPVYRDIVTANGVPSGYLPTRPPVVCSIVDPPSSCTEPVTFPR
ncbi:glycoside hydrolase family 1 protein [Nocardia sp. GCM10030253]|uniref:glycoside hydrolase family 1 protein n=1 Tax=Nocardia sp. GCM10030253 TaxID=3273404 RepID=UPI003632E7D2